MPKNSYDPYNHPYCEFFRAFSAGEAWALALAKKAAEPTAPFVPMAPKASNVILEAKQIDILPPTPKPQLSTQKKTETIAKPVTDNTSNVKTAAIQSTQRSIPKFFKGLVRKDKKHLPASTAYPKPFQF